MIKALLGISATIKSSIDVMEKPKGINISKDIFLKPAQKQMRLHGRVMWDEFCGMVDCMCRSVGVKWPNDDKILTSAHTTEIDLNHRNYFFEKRKNRMTNLICLAVHSSNTRRSSYISQIMTLDQIHQITIMKIIEQGLAPSKFESIKSDEGNAHEIFNKDENNVSSKVTRSSPNPSGFVGIGDVRADYVFEDNKSSPSKNLKHNVLVLLQPSKMAMFSPRSRVAAMHLEKQITTVIDKKEKLVKALDVSTERESLMEKNIEKLKSQCREASLKNEVDFLEIENGLCRKYEIDVKKLQQQLEKATNKITDLTENNIELQAVKDEADVLRHTALKLETTEELLRKTKSRLEEYSDVNDQLIREEEAHGKAIDRVLNLEYEISKYLPLKL